MKKEEIRNAYDEVKLTPEENAKVLNAVYDAKEKKRFHFAKPLLMAAALALCMFSIPSVRVYAGQMITRFRYLLFSETGESLEMNLENQTVKHDIRLPGRFSSIAEIEEMTGVDLLDTLDDSCVREGKLMKYSPIAVTDEKNVQHICGLSVQDFAYIKGDLKQFRVLPEAEAASAENEFRYEKGNVYGSPVALQIRVITDAEALEEAGLTMINVQEELHRTENESVEIYHVESIDADAMIVSTQNVSMQGMGPALWEEPNPGIEHMVSAYLNYSGIEYTYFADVSVETMKQFLETLR